MPQSLRPSLKPIGVLQTVTSVLVPMADRPSSTDDDFRSSYNDPLAIAALSGPELQSCTDLAYADEQRESFNKLLITCLKEFPHTRTRPVPVIISDGKVVDLYELSNSVKKQGGFDLVSANKMWASIAGDLGFGAECAPSLKLVYVKYLKLLDKWLQRAGNPKCNGLSLDHQGKKRNGEMLSFSEDDFAFQHVDSFHGTGLQKSPIVISDNSEQTFYLPNGSKQTNSGVQETSDGSRRNVSLSGMLEWINWVARNPCSSMKGQGSKMSKRSEEWFQECLSRANRAREVLYLRRQEYQSGDSVHAQKKQKVHPSLYEESSAADHQALDRLRATEKRVALYGFQQSPSASPSVTSSVPGNHTLGSYVSSVPNCLDTRVQDVPRAPTNVFLCLERMPRKRIPIGPYFQAVVPPWDGLPKQLGNVACSSVDDLEDSKFLGTQIWPVRGGRKVVNKERIGKGRSNTCFCEFPGSIECVRFHIQEERERLKSELGSAFFTWRFDDMGEDVSRSWAPAEERKFRALVRLNPVSIGKNFWNHLPACFPSKSMEMLVSYYFNVFVLRRRSIQNRAMPEQIDSDDDESEFGFVENFNMHGMVPSGMRNVERLSRGSYLGQSSGSLVCHQNLQDDDFDVLGERISQPLLVSHGGVRNRHGTTSCLNYSMAESGINEDGR